MQYCSANVTVYAIQLQRLYNWFKREKKNFKIELCEYQEQWIFEYFLPLINQSISQSINQTLDQSINQSVDQSNNQTLDQSVNQSNNLSIGQPIYWARINQSINWRSFRLVAYFVALMSVCIFSGATEWCFERTSKTDVTKNNRKIPSDHITLR